MKYQTTNCLFIVKYSVNMSKNKSHDHELISNQFALQFSFLFNFRVISSCGCVQFYQSIFLKPKIKVQKKSDSRQFNMLVLTGNFSFYNIFM